MLPGDRTTDDWRRWARNRVDEYLGDLAINYNDFLEILKRLDDARGQVERILKAQNEERERL
jgi:hypothetical protein